MFTKLTATARGLKNDSVRVGVLPISDTSNELYVNIGPSPAAELGLVFATRADLYLGEGDDDGHLFVVPVVGGAIKLLCNLTKTGPAFSLRSRGLATSLPRFPINQFRWHVGDVAGPRGLIIDLRPALPPLDPPNAPSAALPPAAPPPPEPLDVTNAILTLRRRDYEVVRQGDCWRVDGRTYTEAELLTKAERVRASLRSA